MRPAGNTSAMATPVASSGPSLATVTVNVTSSNKFGRNTTGNANSFFGERAGKFNSVGINNSFFGNETGLNNTTGVNNSFFGRSAGMTNDSGSNNSFFGTSSGFSNSTGSDNSAFGFLAGQNNTIGHSNSFFGKEAGKSNSSGDQNSFFGHLAGSVNSSGRVNSFFGASAGEKNTGIFNSFLGASAGRNNLIGAYNTFVGAKAGEFNVTGNGNIFIGAKAGPILNSPPINDRLFIDNITSNDPLIYAEFDNDFVKINGTFEVTAGLNNPSSKHLKNTFADVNISTILAKVADLSIQEWSYKNHTSTRHIGPVAEDFYRVFGLGSNTSISTIDASGVALIAIQALKAENDEIKKEIKRLQELIIDNQ